jgi:hypothetical protein
MHKKSKRNLSSTLILLQNELTTPKIEKHSDGIGEKQLNSSSITYLNLFAIVWMTFMLFIQ